MNEQDKELDDILAEIDRILPNFLALRGIMWFKDHWEMDCRPVTREYVCKNVPLVIQGIANVESVDWAEAVRGGILELMFALGVIGRAKY